MSDPLEFCGQCGTRRHASRDKTCRSCGTPWPRNRAEAPSSSGELVAVGINGILELHEDRVRIKRKGVGSFFAQGLKGEKDIWTSQISSIQFKNAGRLTNGYIQLGFIGGTESKSGLFRAVADENTVMFNRPQQPAFNRIRSALESKISKPSSTPQSSLADLEKLAELRDKGIVSPEEFDAKKRKILDAD